MIRHSIFTVAGLALTLAGASAARAELTLSAEPQGKHDLAFDGTWAAVPDGEVRYATRADLAALPGAKTVRDRPWATMPEADLTVVPISVLTAELGWEGDADGLVLTCEDRWESWLPNSLVEEREPYLLLYYNGNAPGEGDGWPIFNGIEAMAPYYVFVSPADHPDFKDETPHGMISATQVVKISAANEEARYKPFYAGANAALSDTAKAGRTLFLANCNSCHQGPGMAGGNVSQRPFMVLQTHAKFNADYFRKMVTDPKQFYPETIMPRHPQFTDEDFAALIAFLSEATP
ncbi:c-type cytochrome [Actomonas aquatica]|uniref:C-type cytochrome n=1 Tax=Actomonas aquatica TaxID=2866162 RepID=A0ABZ1CC40_9BACT|nr:cytochrome c [Opitutus sp. WL0086]WRQ88882.1 c-type cytochrome [Opitutus sp. WL0086]